MKTNRLRVGVPIRLVGITKKGKEVLKNTTDVGIIEKVQDQVIFSDDRGPWILVSAGGGRWVHLTRDQHFTIEEWSEQ